MHVTWTGAKEGGSETSSLPNVTPPDVNVYLIDHRQVAWSACFGPWFAVRRVQSRPSEAQVRELWRWQGLRPFGQQLERFEAKGLRAGSGIGEIFTFMAAW